MAEQYDSQGKHAGSAAEPPGSVQDEPGSEGGVAEGQEELESLRVEVLEARAQAEDNWDHYLRARAEIDNLRKRMTRDIEQARRVGVEKLGAELLAVRDSLELGLQAAASADVSLEQVREGTELTLRLLTQAMDKVGIERLDPIGQRFDPERHEAMAMQDSSAHAPNTVISVIQHGYCLQERLLRPARVIVASAQSGAGAGDSATDNPPANP
jgi:molecular chaperone GrpE